MKPVRFCHTADLHLGIQLKGLGEAGQRRERDLIAGFEEILALCQEEAVDYLLIAGDFLEGTVSTILLQSLIDQMEKAAPLRILIAPGNHDYDSLDAPYRTQSWPKNVLIFHQSAQRMDFPEDKLSVYGGAFQSAHVQRPFFTEQSWARLAHPTYDQDPDWTHIGLFHGDLVAKGQASLYHPIDPSSWPKDLLCYVALGHIHQRSPIYRMGQTQYAYAGVPVAWNFRHPGSQGVFLAQARGHFCSLQFHPLSFGQFIDLPLLLGKEATEEALIRLLQEKIHQGGRAHFYRFHLQGFFDPRSALSLSPVLEALSLEASYLELVDERKPSLNWDRALRSRSLSGSFYQTLRSLQEEKGFSEELMARALRLGLSCIEEERRAR